MSNNRFASKTLFTYYRGLKDIQSQRQLNDVKFILFSNPLMLNRIENNIQNEIKPGPNPEPEPVFNNKMVGIFSPSTSFSDQVRINSIKCYWTKNPKFEPFLILEYDGTQEDYIKQLNNAYNLGKRYVFGFTTSSSLFNSLDWLNQHPDVQGVTVTAASDTLAIPKKIYRTITDIGESFSVAQYYIFDGAKIIYYIYNSNQLISYSFKTQLLKYCQQYGISLIEFPYNSLDEVDYTNVQYTINDIYTDMSNNEYTKTSICYCMVDYATKFINLFNSGMANVGSLGASYFDLNTTTGIIQNSTIAAKTYFNNILYLAAVTFVNGSKLFYTCLPNSGSLSGLNILYQLNDYNGYVNQLGTYQGNYILDPITRDNIGYPVTDLLQYQLSTTYFESLKLIYKDTNGDLFECIFNN